MVSLPQPPNPSVSAASSSTPPTVNPSLTTNNPIDANQTPPPPSSNMNNDPSTQNGRAKRNKRDSRKKREAKGNLEVGVDGSAPVAREKKSTTSSSSSAIPSSELTMLMPIQLADPRPTDVLPPRPRQMNFSCEKHSEVLGQSWKFYEIADKLSNRNGFRYTYAAMDPSFPHIKYRQTDVPPYYSRFSYEDSPAAICFTEDGLAVTTNEPWHSARANVCAREGSYYYEARVISGIVKGSQQTPSGSPRGNIRLGFARREADLDVNVGVDCYGYGIRDASNNLGVGKRENADDGMIGYFPIVSCHGGGAVEARFEGPWWVGPPSSTEIETETEMDGNGIAQGPGQGQVIKSFGERYDEQIVEDVLAEIVDEIEALFMGWGGDGTTATAPAEAAAAATAVDMAVNSADGAGVTDSAAAAAGLLMDDGTSVSLSVGTPQYGSVAGETVVSEDVEMSM
ncbi:histone-lysine N-methyltransferase Bre2 [Blastomyces gilchristii SLH14081]|uniref:Histone-lysine N-methyltransferase Bre2 n=1 Tax=Blastomyces gilchristii (strain SLH14081) TaxID=559298 RepID=A0A179UZH3_BLAGS|nr:histone-lysine N-methyltransferase Bre2 [Blastomyces gilchristii SLH14081]OAT13465.1 histone-lysine N-methyltransferase Bre2 [Blastomyces gilchristii SLH14081]